MQSTPMKKIRNLKELHSERLRLQLELIAAEEILKEDLEWIKEEIKPGKIAAKLFSNIIGNKTSGLLNNGVRGTIDILLKNILLSKSGWITRFIVPLIIKNLSSSYLAEKKPEIFGILRNIIHKARTSLKQDDIHFDKSTVDEMDY